jgi:hypothetical protein
MTIARKNAQLAQTIAVSGSAVGDTLYVPYSGSIGINTIAPQANLHVIGSGIFSDMVYVNGIGVTTSGHTHTIPDITSLTTVLDKKIDDDDIIEGGFF